MRCYAIRHDGRCEASATTQATPQKQLVPVCAFHATGTGMPYGPILDELAREYALDVAAREQLDDRNAAYHAQEPKVRAYKLLLDCGFGPKQAVVIFSDYLKKVTT